MSGGTAEEVIGRNGGECKSNFQKTLPKIRLGGREGNRFSCGATRLPDRTKGLRGKEKNQNKNGGEREIRF